jgi:NADPH-dependent 2,4-dienoyl-CoA reductase/sulfur reductase-like enzyme/peroxiredoxin family protein/rhodanese-related sulfurtransferase/TusA-related sulfurtransferase
MKKVLIIGGVAGGASTAARLRRNDEDTQIVMFERGEYISYANCGLPYYLGGVIKDRDKLFVQTVGEFSHRLGIDVRVSQEVVSINRTEKWVEVKDLNTNQSYKETYDKLVLSPGAKSMIPPIPGIDQEGVYSLRNVKDTDRIKAFLDKNKPESALVIGAGYIGIEMAENLKHVCDKVTIVEMADRVLPFFDVEIAAMMEHHIVFKGVDVLLNERVVLLEKRGKVFTVTLQSGLQIDAEIVIVAAGVKPDTGFVGDSGLELTANGSLVTNEYMQTNDPNIYAVGDAISCYHKVMGKKLNMNLAGPAAKQGRIVADNIVYGNKSKYEGTIGTSIIKVFDLTVGYTGVSEDYLKKENVSYIASFTHNSSHAGYYPMASPISIKIMFTPDTGKLLGAQIIGYKGVDKRVDVLAAFIHNEKTVYDLTAFDHAYAPPYSSSRDPVTVAGFVAENILKGKMKIVHWHELTNDFLSDTLLVDVRNREECELGAIPGFKLIPLDELRERASELPQDKRIVIYCEVGRRGYLAVRMLMQKGFREVYNLSGGYKTYQMVNRLGGSQDTFEDETVEVDDHLYHRVGNDMENQSSSFLSEGKAEVIVDACGLQCPGPIMKLKNGMDGIEEGQLLTIQATDPGFASDLKSWCRITGNSLVSISESEGVYSATISKGRSGKSESDREFDPTTLTKDQANKGKTLIVFSDDMDRALASFVIANGAAATGRKVTMFFTFWGLNVIKKVKKPNLKRDLMGSMFGKMMPGDSTALKLSKLNMMGIGSKMMRFRMKDKKVDSLEQMILTAMENGVRFIACQMSMDVMGVYKEDLIDNVEVGGVATYLEEAENANLNLFI